MRVQVVGGGGRGGSSSIPSSLSGMWRAGTRGRSGGGVALKTDVDLTGAGGGFSCWKESKDESMGISKY